MFLRLRLLVRNRLFKTRKRTQEFLERAAGKSIRTFLEEISSNRQQLYTLMNVPYGEFEDSNRSSEW